MNVYLTNGLITNEELDEDYKNIKIDKLSIVIFMHEDNSIRRVETLQFYFSREYDKPLHLIQI